MKVIISESRRFEIFLNIFKHAKEVNESFNIRMDSNGMFMQGLDQSHILVLEFKLNKEWFELYEFDEENDVCPMFNIPNIPRASLHADGRTRGTENGSRITSQNPAASTRCVPRWMRFLAYCQHHQL